MAALKKVLALCDRRGFIYDISGGRQGFVYGPLGTDLRQNIVNEWRQSVNTSSDRVYSLHSTIRIKEDEESGSGGQESSLRHQQLAQRMYETMNVEVPFGIAQIFRRDPKIDSIFRDNLKEREVADIQFFCPLSEYRNWCSKWLRMRLRWWKKYAVNPEKFFISKDEKSTSNLFSASIKFQFPDGEKEVESLSNRDVSQFCSKEEGSIALSTEIDEAVLAYICDAYQDEEASARKRIVLKFHACLAPYKAVVLARERNSKLEMYCRKLAEELRQAGISTAYTDGNHSFEESLAVQDEMGTPFRIIGTKKTLETGTVFLQDRNTTLEEEMNGQDVFKTLFMMLQGARFN